MKDLNEKAEQLTCEIEGRADQFTRDNFKDATPYEFRLIRNAVMIGVCLGLESAVKDGF